MDSNISMKPLYFKQLDTLRFVAFFLVFWQHIWPSVNITFLDNEMLKAITKTGGIGVQVFFVLSGFLITFLLLKEHETTQKINIKHFYLRRALRIWPLYYLVLIFGIFVLPNVSDIFGFCGNHLLSLSFLNNLDLHRECFNTPNIEIAWSVAIEEQYYLVWPIVFSAFVRHKRVLFFICASVFVGSSSFIEANTFPLNYYHTYANLNYLMAGCMGALVFNKHQNKISNYTIMKKQFLPLAIFLLIVIHYYSPFCDSFIQPFLYLYIIILLSCRSSDKKSWLSTLGKYTYGMYMYHPIFIMSFRYLFETLSIEYQDNIYINLFLSLLALIGTIVFSIISYEFMEVWFLKYKNKLSKVKTRI